MTQHNTIRILSDSELLKNLDTLNRRERTITLEILLHLIEVERRRLHLRRGYPSLFRYCTERLGYSESAAGRRIRAARCVRKYPEILDLLSNGTVNICTISIVAGILTRKNKTAILEEIQGKSQREVEATAARYRPERAVRDRVRPVAVWRPVPPEEAASTDGATRAGSTREMSTEGSALPPSGDLTDAVPSVASKNDSSVEPANRRSETAGDLDAASTVGAAETVAMCKKIYRRSGGKKLTTTAQGADEDEGSRGSTEDIGFVLEQKFKLEFAVSPEFMKKLDEVKALLSTRRPAGIDFARLFEILLDEFIDRHSPKKKHERREKRRQRIKKEKTDEQSTTNQRSPAGRISPGSNRPPRRQG